jgi:hypothetical protein
MSNYQSKISQKATYLRVYEGGRMLYGEEVTKVIHNLEKRIVELEKDKINLIEEFAEAACLGEVAKIARQYGYEALKEPKP